jgi:protein-arginine kinase activator protein McsA
MECGVDLCGPDGLCYHCESAAARFAVERDASGGGWEVRHLCAECAAQAN